MALSPNYGWAEPDNSSLVKNGAQDIRALGDAIDTSVWNVGYGQAGKNKIINGDFGIWQRGTSFQLNLASSVALADRWQYLCDDGANIKTFSQQTFTPGTAPVAGYEGTYFMRIASATASATETYSLFTQYIENVRTFAGQTITISFWAKAAANTTMPSVAIRQNFGSGGSTAVDTSVTTNIAVTTSWQRFSYSVAVPSVSGKTIGANSYLRIGLFNPTQATFTLDFWGVQVEYGSKATPFQLAGGGSPQIELAMCQRYYEKTYIQGVAPATNTSEGVFIHYGCADGGSTSVVTVPMQVAKRNVSYSVAIYTTGGTVSNWAYARSGASGNVAMTIDLKSERTFRAYGTTGANWVVTNLNGHWVVDNEL